MPVTMSSSNSCNMQFRPVEANQSELALVTFSNGRAKSDFRSTVVFRTYESVSTQDGLARKRPRKVLVANTTRLEYVAFNYGPEAPRMSGLCKYLVGALGKKTGTMKLYNTQVYQMNPLVDIKDTRPDGIGKEDKSYRQRVDQLTKAFGSKRKQKAMETRLRNRVSDENLGSALKEAIKESTATDASGFPSSQAKETSSEAQSEAIPKQNKKAEKPEEVYSVDSIIPPDEYNALDGEISEFLGAAPKDIALWKNGKKYPTCILRALARLPSEKKARLHEAKLVTYMNYLLQVAKLRYNDMRRKDPLPSVPDIFKMKLLERFTLQSTNEKGYITRTFPDRMKDKVTAYIIVLALMMENYEIDLGLLQQDFKLTLSRLATVASVLGCHILTRKTSEGMTKLATLSIPLSVPQPRTKQRRGK